MLESIQCRPPSAASEKQQCCYTGEDKEHCNGHARPYPGFGACAHAS